jgi:pimeloyl-ACP methyl ester carboxylesterase
MNVLVNAIAARLVGQRVTAKRCVSALVPFQALHSSRRRSLWRFVRWTLPLVAFAFRGGAQVNDYTYTAVTTAPVTREGAVNAGSLAWFCKGSMCSIRGSWPVPGVGACQELAKQVGQIKSYGRTGSMLDDIQIQQCNSSATSAAGLKTDPNLKAVPYRVPAGNTPLPDQSQQVYIAITSAPARRQGQVMAGKWAWTCQGTECTIRSPGTLRDLEACFQLASLVGRFSSFDHAGKSMSADDLSRCNTKAAQDLGAPREQPKFASKPQSKAEVYQKDGDPGKTLKAAPNITPTEATPIPPPNRPQTVGSGVQIHVDSARIGCLDIQRDGNLTGLVASACNNRTSCSYRAPTADEYTRAGVRAYTRTFCTQAMEINFHCGNGPAQRIMVPGDAWNSPPAQLVCSDPTLTNQPESVGGTIAQDYQFVTPPPEPCDPPDPRGYVIPPPDMLDWTPTKSIGDYTFLGFRPPQPATRSMYNSPSAANPGAPASTLGANEGRLRGEIRAVAATRDPLISLCKAAQMFTYNRPASANTPSDRDFGNAFADLSVTGKEAFSKFMHLPPTEAILRGHRECAGASASSIAMALDRAYSVANALRSPHDSSERRALGWIAVSGEDDQPYRPVNVPSNGGRFPEFQLRVNVPNFGLPVNTRYMIAHARNPPPFSRPATPLVDGGAGRRVPADPLPALANDADVILFIHGMDSRLEEADVLTKALHRLGGRNWTVISMDLPTSGYADNIDHRKISPISAVTCHFTPVVDFIEEFIVAFVDTLDGQLRGQLKPRIRAVVGGSLGGNMAMRLGRRPNTQWIANVVPWSPAAIWPSMIAQRNAVAAGCDTTWNVGKDRGVNTGLKWGGLEDRFSPDRETPELRRELFYGGFDWDGGDLVWLFSNQNHQPQAACWFQNEWSCKSASIQAARLDRHETYDANFRAWHWRLGAEQLAFSQQQFAPGTRQPLYLLNTKRMLLFCGMEDVCGDLCQYTRDVASKMVNTPGKARFLQHTGHSLDNEHPNWVAAQIADFLR